jgi:hypothetical protein
VKFNSTVWDLRTVRDLEISESSLNYLLIYSYDPSVYNEIWKVALMAQYDFSSITLVSVDQIKQKISRVTISIRGILSPRFFCSLNPIREPRISHAAYRNTPIAMIRPQSGSRSETLCTHGKSWEKTTSFILSIVISQRCKMIATNGK